MKAFKIENVVKKYNKFSLGPINLDLEPGMVQGYIGPNGAGKSTTLHCLTGLVKPENGKIEIFGRENDPEDIRWKLDIGYVGDKLYFYDNWTASKNLKLTSKFYPNWSDKLAEELIKRFELPTDKKVKELSTGNKVKLALINALAHKPKLLLLDEPTSGLDPIVRNEVLEVLFEILDSGERAILYSTHILSDINQLADELVFINNGNIFLKTPKEDLTEKWRKISFSSNESFTEIKNSINVECSGNSYKLISYDFEKTIGFLHQKSAQDIIINRMSIDEIAVQILKGAKDV